jgi:hypothetical protein
MIYLAPPGGGDGCPLDSLAVVSRRIRRQRNHMEKERGRSGETTTAHKDILNGTPEEIADMSEQFPRSKRSRVNG